MKGSLFIYCREKKLCAFKSGCLDADKAVIFIGGLGDGFLSLPFMDRLSAACEQEGYCLIQVLLSSSYSAFGLKSLQSDAKELNVLIEYIAERDGVNKVHLLGHSTGCQDILWMFKSKQFHSNIHSVILQAPVSDADYLNCAHKDLVDAHLESARKLPKDTIMPFRVFGCPITAYRFVSLAAHGGDDDMFSCHSAQKRNLINSLPVDCLVVMSGKDEYVTHLASPQQLLDEFGARHAMLLAEADHCISSDRHQADFIQGLFKFLADVKKKKN